MTAAPLKIDDTPMTNEGLAQFAQALERYADIREKPQYKEASVNLPSGPAVMKVITGIHHG